MSNGRVDRRRVFFIVFLTIQILLPMSQMFRPKPARFAWQMFSGTSVPTQVKLKTGDTSRTITAQEMSNMIGNWRGDLSLYKHLPPYLCRRFPESDAVLLYNIESDDPKEFSCND